MAKNEKLDPVGREDGDVNNDGKSGGEDDKYLLRRRKAISKASKEDEPKKNGEETAVMNPKKESKKGESTTESVKTADKKPEVYTDQNGKKRTRMVPVDKEIVKKESTNMSIRDRLLSIFEKKDHGDTEEKQKYDDNWSPSAKKMKADMDKGAQVDDTEEKGHDDAEKAARVTKAAPKRSNDQTTGDKNVINKPEDVTKKGNVKEHTFKSMVNSINSAYASMYTPKAEEEKTND